MSHHQPLNPAYDACVRSSFSQQRIMEFIGAILTSVNPGQIIIELPCRPDLTQQHGYIHAGIVTTIVDSACGYAAFSLMPENAGVLTVEYKVNFLSPAQGERLIARGRVVKPGRTIFVCSGDVTVIQKGQEKSVATMLATMMSIQ